MLDVGFWMLARPYQHPKSNIQPLFFAGVVQRIRIPGYEPGDLEVRILPPVPFFGSSSNGLGHSPPKAGIPVRPRTSRPTVMPGSSAGRGDWSNTPAQLSSILSPGTKFGSVA